MKIPYKNTNRFWRSSKGDVAKAIFDCVEKIIFSSEITISDDLKKSVACASNESNVFIDHLI